MQVMLTTKDNPYDPFTQWDDWYAFDEEQGYCTSGYLARIVKTSNEMADALGVSTSTIQTALNG